MVFGIALLFARRTGILVLFGFFVVAIAFGAIVQPGGMLGAWTMPVSIEFLAGVCIAMLFYHREWAGRLTIPCLAIAIALVAFQQFCIPTTNTINDETLWRPWHWAIAGLIVLSAVVCRQPRERSALSRGMTMIGDSSYSLYLTHTILLAQILAVIRKLKLDRELDPYLFFFGSAAIAIVVGWLFHLWIERPITRYLSKRLTKRPPPIGMEGAVPAPI